jgi:OOP family OmpA-OmpF porin
MMGVMKLLEYQPIKGIRPSRSLFQLIAVCALPALASLGLGNYGAHAETITTQTTVTTTSDTPVSSEEIEAQEMALREKILELDRAKLEKIQSDALDMRKAELMIEIRKLELVKARRELQVQEDKEKLAMLLQGDVLFDVNSTVIKPGAAASLRQVGLLLSEYPKGQVIVTGFADSSGTDQDNLKLSRERGESVKTYLLNNTEGMVSSERIISRGRGEEMPVATNNTSAGRQLNRRVEITILKS